MAHSFERDIRPLFRAVDIEGMRFAFDFASHDDVRRHADMIFERLSDGSMPCDEPWPPERIELFRAWLVAGMAP